ncbi:MAG: hypothetical protein ACRD0G_18385 [Acidimicrobiales bacterium]
MRTTNGAVGVPTLVDVQGGSAPPGSEGGLGGVLGGLGNAFADLAVTVLPPPTQLRLTVHKLRLTAPAHRPVQVEVIFDLPSGLGAALTASRRSPTCCSRRRRPTSPSP